MKSYCITEYGEDLESIERDLPLPSGAEVLLEVTGCGVCHSDVHIWEGHFDMGGGKKADLSGAHQLPFTLGHEIAGKVISRGEDSAGVDVGEAVVAYPWIGCGECSYCLSGDEQLCGRPRNLGVHLDGGYATHVLVPDAKYLFPIGDLPPELAATYACSGLTAYGALKKLKEKAAGGALVIIGAGGVGLAALMVAKAMVKAEIIAVDIDPAKRDAALSAGAHHVVDPAEPDARKQIYKLTGGAQAIVDFVGSESSVKFGFGALATGGALVVVGLFGGAADFSLPMFPLKSLTVIGSYVGSPADMAELMAMARDGSIEPLPIATRPLSEAGAALSDLAGGQVIGRVVLTP